MRRILSTLLLLTTACNRATDHAQAVAAEALPRYAGGLRPASLRTYPVSAAELGQYIRGESGRSGHLVTYTCEVATPQPHAASFVAFVDEADSVCEFVPDRNFELFAHNYGVHYEQQIVEQPNITLVSRPSVGAGLHRILHAQRQGRK